MHYTHTKTWIHHNFCYCHNWSEYASVIMGVIILNTAWLLDNALIIIITMENHDFNSASYLYIFADFPEEDEFEGMHYTYTCIKAWIHHTFCYCHNWSEYMLASMEVNILSTAWLFDIALIQTITMANHDFDFVSSLHLHIILKKMEMKVYTTHIKTWFHRSKFCCCYDWSEYIFAIVEVNTLNIDWFLDNDLITCF